MRVTIGDSGLCCCDCATSFERCLTYVLIQPPTSSNFRALFKKAIKAFVQNQRSYRQNSPEKAGNKKEQTAGDKHRHEKGNICDARAERSLAVHPGTSPWMSGDRLRRTQQDSPLDCIATSLLKPRGQWDSGQPRP